MRFHISTLGCPKNLVDSEMMGQLLIDAGHRSVEDPRRADVIVVNTCGFIAPAREESFVTLREFAQHKTRRQKLVAAGCLVERIGDEIRCQVPEVDAIIGTRHWPEIVALFERLEASNAAFVWPGVADNVIATVQRGATMGATAYLKIADGCDAACAFCAIPLIKGPQRSKPLANILREARELASQGVREVILIAQDTTAYGRDLGEQVSLARLLRGIVGAVPALDWLRILYAYPQHVDQALIQTMANLPQVCHYLDLPLQHAHPDVLRRMRRPHNVDETYRLVEGLRDALPDIALRSTFIVGFPGETEAEFESLLAFLRTIRFDKVGIFPYSTEEGTPAAELQPQVPAEIIAERYERAMLMQQELSWERNEEQVGRELPILIDGAGDGISVGRSYRDAPEIDGLVLLLEELEPGEFVQSRIAQAEAYDLIAERLE